MSKPLIGENLAVLVANGFRESDLTSIQKALMPMGVNIRIVSMDHGLVNSWSDGGWGLHFAADKALNTALAADFSMLVVPGGRRSVEKLKLTAHTRRFISGFIDTRKPVGFCNESIELLEFSERIKGRNVVVSADYEAQATAAGAIVKNQDWHIDETIISGGFNQENLPAYTAAMCEFFVSSFSLSEAA